MQRRKTLTWTALGATLLAAGMIMPMAHAQSSDALLDKLVDKGYLTVKEANELREQADKDFDKAYQAKTGMPDWVNQFRIYGDVRGRYEFFKTENDFPGAGEPNKDRSRYRYRLRVGATATLKDNFEVGFRFTSSEPNADGSGGDPISGNTTMQNNGSKKFIYVDLAYGKWTPINSGPWLLSTTVGKMENPFVVSDMVFDADYTPEGGALQAGYAINDKHALKLSGAVFVLDEISQGGEASNDPLMLGVQLRYDAKWTPKLVSTAGVGWFGLTDDRNLGNTAVPNINAGNTRFPAATAGHAAGDLVENLHPIVLDASVTYSLDKFPLYPGAFPIRLGGEFMHNPGADDENEGYWGGIFFGKSGKKGTWELSYRYKYLEEDAWFEEFVDSDFGAYRQVAFAGSGQGAGYRSGTGVKGHIVKTSYSLSDGFLIGATWFYTESTSPGTVGGDKTESAQHRVQIDATWKF